MSGPEELRRRAWQIPDELREEVHRVLVQIDGEGHSRRVERNGFTVLADHGSGQLFLNLHQVPGARHILIEGRSSWRSFINLLEVLEDAETETHRLTLEVRTLPGHEFELDEEDLGRMEYALAQLYGHGISAKLTPLGGGG